MSCSFYSENSPCGPEPGKDNITVKACDKDLSNHLFGLGVSGSTRPELCSEAEILFNRGEFISPTKKQVEEFIPKNRYSLTACDYLGYCSSGRRTPRNVATTTGGL